MHVEIDLQRDNADSSTVGRLSRPLPPQLRLAQRAAPQDVCSRGAGLLAGCQGRQALVTVPDVDVPRPAVDAARSEGVDGQSVA